MSYWDPGPRSPLDRSVLDTLSGAPHVDQQEEDLLPRRQTYLLIEPKAVQLRLYIRTHFGDVNIVSVG